MNAILYKIFAKSIWSFFVPYKIFVCVPRFNKDIDLVCWVLFSLKSLFEPRFQEIFWSGVFVPYKISVCVPRFQKDIDLECWVLFFIKSLSFYATGRKSIWGSEYYSYKIPICLCHNFRRIIDLGFSYGLNIVFYLNSVFYAMTLERKLF